MDNQLDKTFDSISSITLFISLSEFHKIVAWNKLAELCSQFLVKGRKVYVEGRLSTRSWTTQEGQQRSVTEVVIDDMILLDSKYATANPEGEAVNVVNTKTTPVATAKSVTSQKKKADPDDKTDEVIEKVENIDVPPDDIPF